MSGSFATIPIYTGNIGNSAANGYWDLPYYSNTSIPGAHSFNSATNIYKVILRGNSLTGHYTMYSINIENNTLASANVDIDRITIGSNLYGVLSNDLNYNTVSVGETVAMTGVVEYATARTGFIASINTENEASANTYNITVLGNALAVNSTASRISLNSILLNDDGSRIVVGGEYGNGLNANANMYPVLASIDNITTMNWQKNYTWTSASNIQGSFNKAISDGTGNFYATGNISNTSNLSNVVGVICKFDSSGNILWQKQSNVNQFKPSGLTLSNNYCYVLGINGTTSPRNTDLLKLNPTTGNIVSQTRFANGTGGSVPSVDFTNGNLIVQYTTTYPTTTPRVIINMDESFGVNWSRSLGGASGAGNAVSTYYTKVDYALANSISSLIYGGYFSQSIPSHSHLKLPEDGTILGNGVYTITNLTVTPLTLHYENFAVSQTTSNVTLSNISGTVSNSSYPVNTYTFTTTPTPALLGYINLG